MAKTYLRAKAKQLRKQGISIKSIAKELNLSSSTVSYWCREIVLSDEQLRILQKHSRDPFYGKRLEYITKIKKITDEKVKNLKLQGIGEVGSISDRELFLVGVALYWSEGFKKDSQVGFANSDPTMMKLFLKWLYICFGYKREDLIPRLTVNISHKSRVDEIEEYWSKKLNIPIGYFRKAFFQNTQWKKVYENPNDYFGVLRIKVKKSKDFLRKIHGFIEGLRLESNIDKIH